jgi:hypothetical protein
VFRAFVVVPAALAVGLAVAGGLAIAEPLVPQKPVTTAERHEHERAELRARSRLGAHIGAVTKLVGADAAYGGIWVIDEGSGTIGVGWVGKPGRATVASVEAAVPDPARVRFIRVSHSEKSLLALQQAVFDDVVGDRQGITPFRSSDVDEVHRRVDVTVSNHATAKLLRAKYAHEGLVVTVGPGVDFQAASTSHPAGSSGR